MYKNNVIPSDYKYIAELSDNFIVWVREKTLTNGRKYNAYYQYISPSTAILYTEDYKITKGDTYTYNANYLNNGMYSYIDNYSLTFTKDTLSTSEDYISDSDYDRGDFLGIFSVQVLVCVIFVWVFSNLSRLFFKGGLK